MEKTNYIIGLVIVALVVISAWWIHRTNVGEGKQLAETNCANCHDLTQKMRNKTGPYLWGVMNRPAGSIKNFNYSESFLSVVHSRALSWTEANLDVLITDPDQLMPGTKMAAADGETQHRSAFNAVNNEKHRRELITYLRTLN